MVSQSLPMIFHSWMKKGIVKRFFMLERTLKSVKKGASSIETKRKNDPKRFIKGRRILMFSGEDNCKISSPHFLFFITKIIQLFINID